MTETAKRWSASAGTRGKNRVRAFEARSGRLYVEFWERDPETGRRVRRRQALGHRDRAKAVQQLRAIAARFAADPARGAGEICLGSLFDIYDAEVTPRKGLQKQKHDRRTARMFLTLWGKQRPVETLNLRDWDEFIARRRSGQLAPGTRPRPVGNRQIEYDLRWLKAVLRWATRAGANGTPLLQHDPFAGYEVPKERSPARPVVTETQYRALLAVAERVSWQFALALVLANETGHRLSSLRHLRWADVDLERGRLRWRAVHDKIGFEHVTPMSATLRAALLRARSETAAIGEAWVLPSPRHPERPCPKGTLDKWFTAGAALAGVQLAPRARWHGLRRKFATEMKHLPLRDLAYLGGWKEPKTLLQCYQQPDEELMREALQTRRPFGVSVVSTQAVSIDTSGKTPQLTEIAKLV